MDVTANITVAGNVSIGASTILNGESAIISVGGNWAKSGTFIQASGTVTFNGTGAQSINAGNFNTLIVNKSAGTATLTGNVTIDSDLSISAGTLDVSTFSLNRTALGGTLTIASGASLKIGGTANLPANFDFETISSSSTVEYYGSIAQSVGTLGYGNLVFSNGGSVAKTLSGPIVVNGDITINSGATLNGNANTITLYGNWTDAGTFQPGTGTVIMSGASKTISGTRNAFYDLTMPGSYSTTSGSITTITGTFNNTGTFTQGSDSIYFYGNLLNTGTINLNGVTNVMGTAAQTITNNGTFVSGATGVINYNGTIAPQIFSTGTAQYATVNINNTGGVVPILPWLVAVAMNVGPGATFNGNGLSHTILGSVNNNGTIVNDGGTFTFSPSSAKTINLGTNFSCTGIVNFAGTGAITLAGAGTLDLGAVNITNTNAAGITASSDWTLASRLFVGPGATLYGGTGHTTTLHGNINVTGTFDGGTSTVIMVDTAAINGIGSLTFNNLTIASMDSLLTEINVAGNFTNNGSFSPNGFGITFTGSGASSIGGSTTPVPFAYLTISKSAATATLAADISVSSDLTVSAGATFAGSNKNIDIKGDWINDGTFAGNTSTVSFSDTTVDQQIQGSSTCAFYNLNITNEGFEVSLANNISVAGALTLGSNATMITTGYELIFVSTASGTGRLATVPASATFTGNIRMQRYLPAVAGRYWYQVASPVTTATAAMWQSGAPTTGFYITGSFTGANSPGNGINSNSTSAFSWNAATGIWNRFPTWENTETISPKTGYRVFIRDGNAAYNSGNTSSKTFSVLGPPNIGNQTFTLSYNAAGGSPAGGWNLIGNPYPSNINGDLNNAAWTTKTNLDGNATYIWNSSTNTYVSCNGGVGSCTIPSSQAFWVKVNVGGGSLVATENVKTTGSLSLFRTAGPNYMPIKLTNKETSSEDVTYVRFEEDAHIGFDNQYDAYKLSVASSGTTAAQAQLSTLADSLELSIDARPLPTSADSIVLNTIGNTGNYTLDFSEREALDNQYRLYLKDRRTSLITDLQKSAIVNFSIVSSDSSTFGQRFVILFASKDVVTYDQNSTKEEIPFDVFPNPVLSGSFTINIPGGTQDPKVVITDVTGKEIYGQSYTGFMNKISIDLGAETPSGTYILTLKSSVSEKRIPILLK